LMTAWFTMVAPDSCFDGQTIDSFGGRRTHFSLTGSPARGVDQQLEALRHVVGEQHGLVVGGAGAPANKGVGSPRKQWATRCCQIIHIDQNGVGIEVDDASGRKTAPECRIHQLMTFCSVGRNMLNMRCLHDARAVSGPEKKAISVHQKDTQTPDLAKVAHLGPARQPQKRRRGNIATELLERRFEPVELGHHPTQNGTGLAEGREVVLVTNHKLILSRSELESDSDSIHRPNLASE
jgi:hypothetical protein